MYSIVLDNMVAVEEIVYCFTAKILAKRTKE